MSMPRSTHRLILNYRVEAPPVLTLWERVGVVGFMLAAAVVVAITWLGHLGREC